MEVTTQSFQNSTPLEINYAASFTSVVTTTLGGVLGGGFVGGGSALIASTADEWLIQNGYETKHHLSSTGFWSSFIIYPFLLAVGIPSPISALTSLVSGFAISHFSDDFFCYKNKLNTPLDSFVTLNRLFDENNVLSKEEGHKLYDLFLESPTKGMERLYDDAKQLYQNPYFMSLLKMSSVTFGKTLANLLITQSLGRYASSLFITTFLKDHESILAGANRLGLTPLQFIKENSLLMLSGMKVVSLIVLRRFINAYKEYSKKALEIEMFDLVMNKTIDILMQDDNGRRIASTKKGRRSLRTMIRSLNRLHYRGVMRFETVFEGITEALGAFYQMLSSGLSSAIYFPYFLTSVITQKWQSQVLEEVRYNSGKIIDAEAEYWDVLSSIMSDLEEIKLRDGDDFIKAKYSKVQKAKAELSINKEYYEAKNVEIQGLTYNIHSLFDMFLLGYQAVVKGVATINILDPFKRYLDTATSHLSTNLQFKIHSSVLDDAKEKLEKIFEILETQKSSQATKSCSREKTIHFQNYSLFLNGEKLLTIEDFDFELGKRYAITGGSGCGKSSTLIDLKAGVNGALSSEGDISIYSPDNQEPKMLFLNQDLYLPKDSPLLEAIYFPNLLEDLSELEKKELRKKVIALFHELKIDSFLGRNESEPGLVSKLDSAQFKLSGGQKKKIGIIQAILAQPKIIIMDETFTGLDHDSLILCQEAIKKYLSDSLILVVDHHANENNNDGFYDSEVHFSSETKTVEQKELQPPERALLASEARSAIALLAIGRSIKLNT